MSPVERSKSGVWVLLRWTDIDHADPGDVKVIGVYQDHASVERKVQQIAQANPQYPMRQLAGSLDNWVIGPGEDEGLFGHKPIRLQARESVLYHPDQVPT